MKMYCIYDKKGELMNPPFTQANNAMAIRQFQMMINQPSSRSREGAWIEILKGVVIMKMYCVAPARERGLKYHNLPQLPKLIHKHLALITKI